MRILITAGPTREPLDPVRFLSNRSSGKMGYALAAAAVEAGHEVVLVSGPVVLAPPPGVELHRVETAQEMLEAVSRASSSGAEPDIAVHAAAVSDYRPKRVAAEKIKKHGETLTLELERTPDVLGSMRGAFGFTGFLVGFAAETEDLIANARQKLHRKGCDMVIANDVSRAGVGFDSDENEVVLCFPEGKAEKIERMNKVDLAKRLIRRIIEAAREKLIAGG
jgi:phosphopantothenoylcysteine decarboxylase/phosphopantothenate--cysteine ligase